MHRSFQERTWQKIYEEERRNTEALKERIASGMAGTPTSRKQAAVEAMTIKPKSNAPEFLQAYKAGAIQEDITNIYTQRVERNDPYWKEEELKELTRELSRYEKGLPKTDVQYKNLGDRLTSREFYKTLLFSIPMMDESLIMTIGAGVVGAGLIALGGPIGWAAGGGLIAASIAKATTMESKDEGSSSYQEVFHRSLEEGKTVQEAHWLGKKAFYKTTRANMALLGAANAAEMGLVFFGPQWSALAKASKAGKAIKLAENTIARAGKVGDFAKAGGKILATGEIEGISERLQTGISQWATGQEVDLFSPEAKEAHWAGRVFGATFAGGGMVAQSLRRSGVDPSKVKVDPSKVKVDIGYSGDDLDTPVGGGEVQESVQSARFPKVSDVDPILEENYITKIREGLSEDRVTILNNKIMANMDAGMTEDEAVYSAFDDLMAQDKEAQRIIFRAYVETLSEYQGQSEKMFNRFAVYGAVLNKLPQEQRAMLLDTIVNTMQETGDADGSFVYDSVMSKFLFTPEGSKIFDSLGLQDGSFWRQRNEELMDILSRIFGSLEFADKVKYIEASLARADESALGGLAFLVYNSTGGDLNAGLDIFDALYDNGNVDRSLIDQLGNEYVNVVKQAQPDFFARQSEVELMNAQSEREAQQVKEYVGRLKIHTPFVIKYNRALKKQTEEQKAVQQETENVIKDFVNKHPVLQRNLSELTEAYAYAVEPDEKQAKIQELVQKAFGHKVVFFEASPVIDQYGGPKGAFNKETGTIFVNVNSENPVMAVIGHELIHAMIADEGFDKSVFREYLTAVENAGIKDKEYVKALFDMLDAGADISQEFVEMAGDIMGQAINSEQFWINLHKESPRAFEQLYNYLKKIVEHIKSLFTDVAPEHDVKQVFAEADALLQMAEKVGQQYSQHRQNRAVVRTHSILIEGSSGKKSQKQVFFVYDKDTDQPIWRAPEPGTSGRAAALEIARRVNAGEATPGDIIAEYGEVEPVRQKGETDKKLSKIAREEAEEKYRAAEEAKAFAPGNIALTPHGKEVVILEEKESTVRVRRTDVAEGEKGGKPYWIAKRHLTPIERAAEEVKAFAPGNIALNPQGKEVVILEEKESTVRVRRIDVAEGEKGGKPYWIAKKHLTPIAQVAEEAPVQGEAPVVDVVQAAPEPEVQETAVATEPEIAETEPEVVEPEVAVETELPEAEVEAEVEAEAEAETEAETPDFEVSMTKAFDPDANGLHYWDNIVAWASEVERYAKDGDEATTEEALGYIRKALRLAYDSEEIDPAEAEEWGLPDVYAVEEYNEERSDSIKRLEVISEELNERLLTKTPPKKFPKQGKVIKEQAPQTPKVTKQEKAPKVTTKKKVEESSELDDILSDLELTLSNADLVSEEELAQLRAQELKDLLDLFDSNPDTGSDTGVEFQSMQRGGINYYERAKQVLSKTHPEALKDLERVKDNPDAIRKLVIKLHNAEEGKATRFKEAKQQKASPELKEISEKTKDLLARGQAKKMLRAKEMDKVKKQFDKINEILASGKELTDKQLATLNKVFVGYNEVMSPTSLEDSVPVRVLKRLGLNLHMGIEKRREPMTGEQVYKYVWKISGNIATYGEYLYKMNWVYNEVERCYEWVTADANNSPVPRLMEKFGGDEYVQEAQNQTGETDDRGYLTRLPRRTDVTRLTGTKYKTGSGKSSKELFVTKGVKANKNPKINIGKKAWDVLEEHQKDGVALAIQGLDTHGAFILADGTGAGKTAQMLAVAEHYSRSGKDVLLVLHDAKSFKEAFLRDADLLGIPRAKFKFLAATKNEDQREKMRKGSINAITYNYLSLGDEPIVQKLGRIPDVVIFDEAHNLKNAYQGDMVSKSLEGVDLSLAAEKVMFVTATVAEKGEHLLYLEKFGFLDKEYGGIEGFMQKMGYYFVENKESSAPGRWLSRDTNYTTNQMDLLFHELTDAGLFLKRELALDGVSVEVHEYKVGATIRNALDKIVEIVEQGSQNPLSKSRVWRAQRRYLETQKIEQIEKLAIKEVEDGRHVIVFASLVNPTTLIEQVKKGLYDSYWFQEKVRKEANKKRRRDLSKSEKHALLDRLLQEELLKKGEIPDGPGTLTELKKRFDLYFREKQEKQGESPYYSQVAQIYGNIDPMKTEIPKFQNGVARIALATIQKGGVSISLDDTHGNRPRTVIFAVPPFSAIETLQAIGRAWRVSTKSDVKVIFVKADHAIDDWGFDITRRKLGMLGATGQIDAVKAAMALDDSPVSAGELTGIGTRKETPTVTYNEEGVAEFQESWRSRYKAVLDEANRLKSLKALREANDYYYENRIKESKAAGNDAVTNRLREEKRNVAEHLEVMSEVRDNSINFFVDYFASQARASRPTQPVGAETVAEQPGTETEGSQPVKQERILDTIARIFNTKINDPEERKLALTPGEVVREGAQGIGFALGEGALQDAAIEVKRSVDNVKLNPLEKFLVKDNLMNIFLMGAIQYQADVNGKPLTIKEKWRYYKSMAYYKAMRNFIDDKAALRLMEELACGKLADADDSIYKLARMYGGIENRTYHKLLKDFRKTAELLTDEEGNYSDEMEHIVAKLAIATHAMDVNKFFRDKAENKRENASGFSDERIQELLDEVNAELAKMPEGKRRKVRQAHRELVKFYQKILDDMLEGEVITEKTYNTLKEAYPNYVPMFRYLKNSKIIDFDPAKDIKDAVSFEGVLEPIMGRKGSTLPIQDMLTSAMESYTRAQRAIEMNSIIRKMDIIIEGFAASGMEGVFVKKYNNVPVLKDMYVVQADGREVPASGLTEEDLEALEAGTVIRSKSRDRATFVVGKEKGKIVIYEAHSEVIAALQTMSRQLDDNWVWKLAKGFGDILRTGATATPEFWIKNAFKDTFHGYQATDSGVTFKDLCETTLFLGTPKEDPRLQVLWEEFLEDSAGMGNFLHDIVSRHNDFYRDVTGRKSMKDYSPIRWLQEKATVAENISRFTEYVKAREAGASRKEAAFRSMDQQDFGMAGTWIRPVNSVIPFFNSPIQSKYKLWRQFKKNPKEFLIRAMWSNIPITLVSMALRALASDDQKRRIDEAHSYIRVNYWLVPIPFTDAIVRIPKPFDTSMLFANTLETFLEYVFDKDPATATQYMKEWATDNFMHSVMPSSMFPQVLNVMGEASTGFNQFYGMSSVPASLQDELAMYQYTSETPHLLIGWGRLMGSIGLEDATIASPIAMQSLINTTFGGLGTLTLDLTDMAIEGANYLINAIAPVDVPTYREKMVGERPYTEDPISRVTGMDAESLPMLRVFLLKDDYGTSMNKVYRKWETLEKQKKRYDRLIENGQVDAAYRAMPDKDWNLYWYLKECVDIRNTFGPANSLIRTFRDTPYLSPAEKGYWIKEIEKERGRLARETLVFIKMYEAGLTPEVLTEQYYLNNGLSSELKAKVKLLDKEFGEYIAQTRANNAANK